MNERSTWKRRVTQIVLGLAMTMIAVSCDKEVMEPGKGRLTISFSAQDAPSSSGRKASESRPSTVILSVVDENGNTQDYVRLPLLAFGEGYVSENLELAAGRYRLTDFFVMDEGNNIIYSTPKEGSPLAQFVSDPLDIEFNIRNDYNTQVNPEVIAVEDATQPGEFGYSSFTFSVVDITGLLLPETSETIVKVSYEFTDQYMFSTYKGEQVPYNGFVNLEMPQLLNRIWKAYITIWTEPKECTTQYSHSPYQKVYRLTTELTFTGAAFQLPHLASKRWDPFYYRKNERGIGFFFSADPLNAYHVEIQVPEDLSANYCWLDRRYWNTSGGETCTLDEDDAYAHLDMEGMSVGRFRMDDQPVCETAALSVVDSFVAVNSNEGAFHEFFSWTMVNGQLVPSCMDASSSGRLRTPTERLAPR